MDWRRSRASRDFKTKFLRNGRSQWVAIFTIWKVSARPSHTASTMSPTPYILTTKQLLHIMSLEKNSIHYFWLTRCKLDALRHAHRVVHTDGPAAIVGWTKFKTSAIRLMCHIEIFVGLTPDWRAYLKRGKHLFGGTKFSVNRVILTAKKTSIPSAVLI